VYYIFRLSLKGKWFVRVTLNITIVWLWVWSAACWSQRKTMVGTGAGCLKLEKMFWMFARYHLSCSFVVFHFNPLGGLMGGDLTTGAGTSAGKEKRVYIYFYKWTKDFLQRLSPKIAPQWRWSTGEWSASVYFPPLGSGEFIFVLLLLVGGGLFSAMLKILHLNEFHEYKCLVFFTSAFV